MNKDIIGQFITTWGREIIDDIYVGETIELNTEFTCQCGKTIKKAGFPIDIILNLFTFSEYAYNFEHAKYFCNFECAKFYQPQESYKYVEKLRAKINELIVLENKLVPYPAVMD